jgi:aldose 1-epimerase
MEQRITEKTEMQDSGKKWGGLLNEPSARRLAAGDLEAVFLPGLGMLCPSLRLGGTEFLRCVENLNDSGPQGIPFLHPWTNRLTELRFSVAGKEMALDRHSPLLSFDNNGLPIHGVNWPVQEWEVVRATRESLTVGMDWKRSDFLEIFPFRHRLEMTATVGPHDLTIATTLIADAGERVPVSFGFHPYFGLPDGRRDEWRLTLPAMRRIVLDRRIVPTGEETAFEGYDGPLAELDLDDSFALLGERAAFSIAGGGRQVTVEFLEGYGFAQVYAPKGRDYLALEPMAAPTNALVSGRGLRVVEPGGRMRLVFRVSIE